MLSFRCPRCQGTLIESADSYTCSPCASIYPIIAGIADFRLYADPYIELQADRDKGLRLHEQSQNLTFAELVRYYYSITPEVPDDLGRHYANHHLAGTARGEGVLNRIEHYKLAANDFTPQMVLDLGCGTGGLLAAARNRFSNASVVGVDIAFRWLIIARKRLQELGWTNVKLVCACADHLPFEEANFDLVVAENLIEHMSNTDGLFAEIERVRRPNSAFLARTVNRFAVGPEPHVGVWGVGYLPKPLMNPYVQLIKKIPYEHIHLESSRSLNRALTLAQSNDLRVRRAVLTSADYQHHPGWKKKLFQSFEKIASLAGPAEPLFTEIGPYLDVTNARAIPAKQNRSQQLSVR